jgi:hypothetical protein
MNGANRFPEVSSGMTAFGSGTWSKIEPSVTVLPAAADAPLFDKL